MAEILDIINIINIINTIHTRSIVIVQDKIKNCPHCNGVGEIQANYSRNNHCYFVFVKCTLCGAQGKVFSTTEEPAEDMETVVKSISAWNMRYKESEQ